jgi:hypothetical protein
LAGTEFFHALGPGNQLAAGRENARDSYQVTRSDSGGPKRQFEAGKLFPVFPYTFSEKHAFGYEHSIPHLLIGAVFSQIERRRDEDSPGRLLFGYGQE